MIGIKVTSCCLENPEPLLPIQTPLISCWQTARLIDATRQRLIHHKSKSKLGLDNLRIITTKLQSERKCCQRFLIATMSQGWSPATHNQSGGEIILFSATLPSGIHENKVAIPNIIQKSLSGYIVYMTMAHIF